uniref:Uncharacterized protein n=1 Tax=Arundo donax TaxID=35708 RepID=A0A0A9EHZ5_ARUDO
MHDYHAAHSILPTSWRLVLSMYCSYPAVLPIQGPPCHQCNQQNF